MDAESGDIVLWPTKSHTDSVISVTSSQNDQCVISVSRGGTIWMWDAQSGDTISDPLYDQEHRISSIALSTDCKRAVLGSDDDISVWDTETRSVIAGPFTGDPFSVILA